MPTSLAQKLQIKAANSVRLYNAPEGFVALLKDVDDGTVAQSGNGPFDAVIVFAQNSGDLERDLAPATSLLKQDGLMWICYPKKSSGVESDLTRDEGWTAVAQAGWQGVRSVAVDEVWSALRFKRVAQADVRGDVAAQYSGAKAALRPIYDRVIEVIRALGGDVELEVRQSYVAFKRGRHFAAAGPSTRTLVHLALKLKGYPTEGRLEPNKGTGGGALTHRIALSSPADVDDEVIALLRSAYERV